METTYITAESVSLPRRRENAHKGDHGRLLIVGGSVGYTGAPNLAASAAVRAGAGLVYLGVPEAIWAVCAVKQSETMPFPLPSDWDGRLSESAEEKLLSMLSGCDALVLGPGLGRSAELRRLVKALVCESDKPMLLDADALWAIGEDDEPLRTARAPIVLTPHEGEFLRLGGVLTLERALDARAFAMNRGCTLVLKGHHTVVAFPDGDTRVLLAGNPGMAKGGSGDVLSGVIGALIPQLPWKDAVSVGCFLHSDAGDRAAREYGEYGMTPSDIIALLPEAEKAIIK